MRCAPRWCPAWDDQAFSHQQGAWPALYVGVSRASRLAGRSTGRAQRQRRPALRTATPLGVTGLRVVACVVIHQRRACVSATSRRVIRHVLLLPDSGHLCPVLPPPSSPISPLPIAQLSPSSAALTSSLPRTDRSGSRRRHNGIARIHIYRCKRHPHLSLGACDTEKKPAFVANRHHCF